LMMEATTTFLSSLPQDSAPGYYRNDPVAFCTDILGVRPWEKQAEILEALRDNRRVAVKSCPGAGKTRAAAMAALWFFWNYYPCKVITTAPNNRQVEKILWAQIRSLHNNAAGELGGVVLTKSIRTDDPEWYAIGFATREYDQQNFQGFHSPNILIIVDEAGGVSEVIHQATEMLMTSSGARLLLIGNPIATGGTFYEAFRSPNWYRITIQAYDTPNVKAGAQVIPGLITPDWVREKEQTLGSSNPYFKSIVLAEFPTEGEDALIPLSWVEAAIERWKEQQDDGPSQPVICGCDQGYSGPDPTVLVWRAGNRVTKIERFPHQNNPTMETAGMLKLEAERGCSIGIDIIGVGAGTYDRLREMSVEVTPVNFGERTDRTDRTGSFGFINKRAALWWALREALDPEGSIKLAIPQDDYLIADLTAPKWTRTSTGKIKIESKEDIKKRLGRSTDAGDALAITFAVNAGAVPYASADSEGIIDNYKISRWGGLREDVSIDRPPIFGGIARRMMSHEE